MSLINVKVKSTGQIGTMDSSEFDPNVFDNTDATPNAPAGINTSSVGASPFDVKINQSPKSGIAPLDAVAQFGQNVGDSYGRVAKGVASLPGYIADNIKDKGIVGGAGQVVKDMATGTIDEYKNLVQHPIKNLTERPVETFLDLLPFAKFGEGVNAASKATESATETAGKTIKVAPFAKGYDPEIATQAEKYNIKTPVSAVTSNKFVKGAEALTQKGMFGSKIAKEADNAVAAIGKAKDDLIAHIDTATDAKATGDLIKKGFLDFEDNFQKQKTALYDATKSPELKVAPAEVQSITKTLQDIVDQKSQSVAPDPTLSFYQNLLSKFTGGSPDASPDLINKLTGGVEESKPTPITYEQLKQTRQIIGNKLGNITDPIATGDKGSLSRLYASISDDLDNTVKNHDPEQFAKLQKANSYYKETINKINSSIGKKIATSDPEKLLDQLVKPNSETAIKQVMELAGPEATDKIQTSFIGKLVNESLDKDGKINAQQLEKNISKYGESTISTLLTPEQSSNLNNIRSQLGEITNVEKAVKSGIKPAEGSQTAFLAKTGGYGALALTNPIVALKVMLADKGLATLFESKIGKDLLTKGVDVKIPDLNNLKAPGLNTSAVGPIAASLPGIEGGARGIGIPAAAIGDHNASEQPQTPQMGIDTANAGSGTKEPTIMIGDEPMTRDDIVYSLSQDPAHAGFWDKMLGEFDKQNPQKKPPTGKTALAMAQADEGLKAIDSITNKINKDGWSVSRLNLPGSLGSGDLKFSIQQLENMASRFGYRIPKEGLIGPYDSKNEIDYKLNALKTFLQQVKSSYASSTGDPAEEDLGSPDMAVQF